MREAALPVSNTFGAVIAVAGVAMLAGGIVALAHCDRTAPGFFGGTICVQNDWSAAGVLLLILGLVVMIMGIVLPFATAPPKPPAPQVYAPMQMMMPAYAPAYGMPYGGVAPGYPAYGQPPAPAAANPPRACTRCGAPVTSQFCASCSAQQW